MLDQVSSIRTNAFEAWWRPLLRRLLAGSENKKQPWRWPREVAGLSDHILLDIGIDPRSVPNPAAEEISRPDLTLSGRTLPRWRTTAKS